MSARPRGAAIGRALVAAVAAIGLLLLAIAAYVVQTEFDRQLRASASGARAVESQVAALATAANGRVLTLRGAARRAYEAAAQGGQGPVGGVHGNVMTYKSFAAPPATLGGDLRAFDRLWISQAGLHEAAPDIALSYVMSAETGAVGNYPALPAGEYRQMSAKLAATDFDPKSHRFIRAVAGRSEADPVLWTPVYTDETTARTRADRRIVGDGRVVSLLAPLWIGGRYRAMVGIDIWANQFGAMLRSQKVPGVELDLVDGDGNIVATSRASGAPLVADPFARGRGGSTSAEAFLGFDPSTLTAEGGFEGRSFASARPIAGTPLRIVAIADLGHAGRQVAGRLGLLLGAMALLYALLCAAACYGLTRVLRPAFRLAEHIERSGMGAAPEVSRLWRPTLEAVDAAFAEQRAAVARIEDAHATTSAVLDAAFDAVVLMDGASRIVSANIAFADLFGSPGAAAVGAPLIEMIADAADRAELERAIAAGEEGAPFVFDARGRGGRRFPAELQSRAIGAAGGRVLRVVFLRDISERRRFEAEVASQREALHQSEKLSALGSLLAGVSHELNNPLSVVIGRSAILAEQLDGTAQAVSLGKLRAAADRCGRIVRTFLAIARRSAPERNAVDLNALVADAIEITGYGMRQSGIEVALDLADGLPLTSADGDQLIQVVINLLINAQHALAALPEGEGRSVRIVTGHQDGMLELRISDSGPGIPDEIRRRIFEPFFTTKPVGEGTGLGLSVSKGIVEAHGGSLSAEPGKDGGAAFRLVLPVEPVASLPAARATDGEAAAAGAILIVDDEPEVAEMAVDCLRVTGARIETAASGEGALAWLAERRFAAIFCDVRMPGMDGIALYRSVAARDPGQAARFVFVTGDMLSGETSRRIAEAGCPVIEKPFEPGQLRALAAAFLARGNN